MKVLLVFAALMTEACQRDVEKDGRNLVVRIEAFRQASMDSKPAAASALEIAPCANQEQCRTKEACLRSSRPTARAVLRKAELGRRLQDGAGAPGVTGAEIDEIEKWLAEGKSALEDCDVEEQSLKRKLGMR